MCISTVTGTLCLRAKYAWQEKQAILERKFIVDVFRQTHFFFGNFLSFEKSPETKFRPRSDTSKLDAQNVAVRLRYAGYDENSNENKIF